MKKKILIVDDKKKIRKVYKQILEKEGFMPFEADDAVRAREILLRQRMDLVLLDLNMPNIRGEELFSVIRAFHKECKVIVSSVYPIDEQRKAAPEADDFYDKSDGPIPLVEKIKFHLNNFGGKIDLISIDDSEKIKFFLAVQ